ncbi:Adenine permease AdeP [Rahnella aquatilis]|nr:Adenine permease AdeP [Rahnella aquatilis]
MSESSVKNVTVSADESWLQRRFHLHQRQTKIKTECLAGITGFLAAAYLLVVIPGLLAVSGIDKGAATTGVILVYWALS